jgi:choline dehydrogenase-like flavoprotein
MIRTGDAMRAPVVRRAHTLVVGSGAGGAVVAHGLATAGVETVVVEEGGWFQAADMTQRDDQMRRALYRAHGQQLTRDGMINVLQGSCYGGSTVTNAADCEATRPTWCTSTGARTTAWRSTAASSRPRRGACARCSASARSSRRR